MFLLCVLLYIYLSIIIESPNPPHIVDERTIASRNVVQVSADCNVCVLGHGTGGPPFLDPTSRGSPLYSGDGGTPLAEWATTALPP